MIASRAGRYIAIAAVLIAGCATTVDGQPATGESQANSTSPLSATKTSATISNTLPGPPPPPNSSTDGTSFDPCVAYPAEEIEAWGVSPAKVEIEGGANAAVRGCRWSSGNDWNVSQFVSNRPISDFLDQNQYPGAHAIDINGLRGAVFWSLPTVSCDVALPSQRATVSTGVMVLGGAKKLIPDPCQKAIEIATRVAPVLPQ